MNITNLVVTDWFATDYKATVGEDTHIVSWDDPQEVELVLYSRIPQFTESFSAVRGLADISSNPEWVPISALTSKVGGVNDSLYVKRDGSTDNLQLVDSDGSVLAIEDDSGWFFTGANTQELVQAAIVYLTNDVTDGVGTIENPVLFATTQGIGQNTVAHTGAVFGQSNSKVDAGSSPFLLSYSYNASTEFLAGYMLLYLSPPQWEPTHTQHIWVQPQRVNLIANPSFERTSGKYWRVGRIDGTATYTRSGATNNPAGLGGVTRPYCGKVEADSGTGDIVLESNLFPKTNNWHSVSFFASNGDTSDRYIKFGFVARYGPESLNTYICSDAVLIPKNGTSNSGFREYRALIDVPDRVTDLQFRIEFTGTTLWVDHVLVDPHEGQYSYFDGNSKDGLDGDFRWMGGSGYENKHFSIWYNNYTNTRSRLMGAYDTKDAAYKPGLLEDWAPTGSNIVAHWDAVTSTTPVGWVGDAFYPIVDLYGTPISTIASTTSIKPNSTFP
jgi:hypothetical protein